MGVKVANYVRTTIADTSGINAAALSFQPASTAGWPALPTAADYFYLTLVSVTTNAKEVVKVTSYTSTTAQITRGQDGTEALTFANGDRAELWVCRAVFTDLQAEQAAALAAVQLVTANYTALSIPASALKDDIITNRHINDGELNGAKLNPFVAGTGMIQDASGNLQVQGGTYIQANADNLDLKEGSLISALSSYKYTPPGGVAQGGYFCALKEFDTTSGGAGVFYTGTPGDGSFPIYGTGNTHGFRFVMVVIENQSAVNDIHVSCYVGHNLNYYRGTGTDVGTEVYKTLLADKSVIGERNMVSWLIPVPPGYQYMFAKGAGVGAISGVTMATTGSPSVITHSWFEVT